MESIVSGADGNRGNTSVGGGGGGNTNILASASSSSTTFNAMPFDISAQRNMTVGTMDASGNISYDMMIQNIHMRNAPPVIPVDMAAVGSNISVSSSSGSAGSSNSRSAAVAAAAAASMFNNNSGRNHNRVASQQQQQQQQQQHYQQNQQPNQQSEMAILLQRFRAGEISLIDLRNRASQLVDPRTLDQLMVKNYSFFYYYYNNNLNDECLECCCCSSIWKKEGNCIIGYQ